MKQVLLLTYIALVIILVSTCQQNNPPVIDSVSADPDTLAPGDTTTLSADAHDDDNDLSMFIWDCAYGTFISPDSQSVMWIAPDSEGLYYCTVVAEDTHGATDKDSVGVWVITN